MKLAREKMKEPPLPLSGHSMEVEVLPVQMPEKIQINDKHSNSHHDKIS
jgi:hypothetical protein